MVGKRSPGGFKLKYISALLLGRKSVLLKTLFIYIIIGSLLFALLSTLLYTKFSENSIREINKVSTDSLEQSMRTFDKLWDALYLYMNKEFHTDATLLEGMERSSFSPVDSSKISTALSNIIDINNAIDSAYLYNAAADSVFSNSGTVTTCDSFYDGDIINIIKNHSAVISKISDCAILYRKYNYSYGSLNHVKNVITVLFSTDDMQTALIFNIDQGMLQTLIAPPDSEGRQNFLIINKQGMVVSDSHPNNIYTNIAAAGYAHKILGSSDKAGYFIDSVDGKKSLITYSHWDKWDTLGWVFVKIADYDGLIGDLKQLQASILLITALFILTGIVAAALFLGNVFRPFYRLIELLRARSPYEPAKMSEFDYIGSVYSNMANDLESLSSYKNNSRAVLRHELLNRVIHGKIIEGEDFARQAAMLNIKLNADKNRVVAFRLDKTLESAPQDRALLKYTACSIAAEHFMGVGGEAVESGEDNISVIISADCIQELIWQAVNETQEACCRLLKLSFTAGIGTVEDGLAGIQYSYKNAIDATAYRFVLGRGAIADYATVVTPRSVQYMYPQELEKGLIESVKTADSERFEIALSAFTQHIERYTYDEMLLALSQMSLIITRTLKVQLEVTHMQEVGIADDIRELDTVIKESDTLEEIRLWLLGYFERCMEVIRPRKSSKYSEIVDSIQKYIDENYCDSCLTIDRIAHHVNLSPNYMRTLFKDHAGVSVSHYINELRFKRAAELLKDTGHPASRIAGMVGFPESSYFYSAFKNTTGMSPEEYRKANRQAN